MSKQVPMILRSYPVQLIDIENGVLIKRGSLVIRIQGRYARKIVEKILELTSNQGQSLDTILLSFHEDQQQPLNKLIEDLIARHILYQANCSDPLLLTSSHLENFYWNFKKSEKEVQHNMSSKKFAIIGVNYISRHLANLLQEMDINNFFILDDPRLRNHHLMDSKGMINPSKWKVENALIIQAEPDQWKSDLAVEELHCVIATSDSGEISPIRQWHQRCFINHIHFLPLTLANNLGHVGPLIIPKQTACYECLIARQNANLEGYELLRKIEDHACEGQDVVGFHPSMATILADFALIELSKFYGKWLKTSLINTFFEVNLLDTRLITRKLLKLPKCSLCSPLNSFPSISPTHSLSTLSLEDLQLKEENHEKTDTAY